MGQNEVLHPSVQEAIFRIEKRFGLVDLSRKEAFAAARAANTTCANRWQAVVYGEELTGDSLTAQKEAAVAAVKEMRAANE